MALFSFYETFGSCECAYLIRTPFYSSQSYYNVVNLITTTKTTKVKKSRPGNFILLDQQDGGVTCTLARRWESSNVPIGQQGSVLGLPMDHLKIDAF